MTLPRQGAAPGAAPLPATIALQFNPARAGDPVWVQPLDGGTVEGTAAGRFLPLSAAGSLGFSFQAPARSDGYRVLVRLDNMPTVLSFLVPPAGVAATPAPAPSATPAPTTSQAPSALPTTRTR